ncbi:glutamine amidotransferase [Bradyrhizobium sp. WD16]|nr:glutamine amidotransferase [Bradyrhizobium sp. WD16]
MSSQATRLQPSCLQPSRSQARALQLPPMPAAALPVLIILHQECSSPGRVGNALRALGFALDIRRPRFGDALPTTLAGHSGAIIFGGPMSANDEADYIRREIDWIAVPLKEGRPFLGICLGAQMLARQLGARVAPHPEGHVEVGYYPIRPTAAGRRVVPSWPDEVYHWHGEGFDLPAGCELLAEGEAFPNQAFRTGSCFGVQFHPDVTMAMMYRWTTGGGERMAAPGARARADHFAARAVHDLAERAWFGAFLHQWFAGDCRPAPSEPVLLEAAE